MRGKEQGVKAVPLRLALRNCRVFGAPSELSSPSVRGTVEQGKQLDSSGEL